MPRDKLSPGEYMKNSAKKVFLLTFGLTLGVMLACFGLVYLAGGFGPGGKAEVNKPQKGISMQTPGVEDSKTMLLALGSEDAPFFFILKFNALQSKVGIMAVSPSFKAKEDTLAHTLKRVGAMQCLMDLKEELGINIDYYLRVSWSGAAYLAKGLAPVDLQLWELGLPPAIEAFVLKRAQSLDADSLANAAAKAAPMLDNELGLAFLNEYMYGLICTNLESLPGVCGGRVKADYAALDTNIDTAALTRYGIIINFLLARDVQYPRQVIYSSDSLQTAREKAEFVTG